MMLLKQSTARNCVVFMTDPTDNVTGKTGLTLVVTASKNGGAFASISPTVTELTNGFYSIALTSSHTDTLGDLALYITATGADPVGTIGQVVSDLPGASVSSVTGTVTLAAGQLAIKKNTALAAFEFPMTDSTTHLPATGLTVTVQRSIDGGAFAACANAAAEISGGAYKIDLAAADLNGTTIMLKFTAASSDTRFVTIMTQA